MICQRVGTLLLAGARTSILNDYDKTNIWIAHEKLSELKIKNLYSTQHAEIVQPRLHLQRCYCAKIKPKRKKIKPY